MSSPALLTSMTGKACVAGSLILLASGLCRAELGPGDRNFGLKYHDRERGRAQKNTDDVGFIRAVFDDLARRVPIDRARIYATGMSNGAMMSYRLAVEAPEAVPPLLGSCPGAKHTTTRIAYGPCHNGTEVVLWKLTGAGHVWPGGDIDYLTWALGPGTDVIEANTQMWRFFSHFRLDP